MTEIKNIRVYDLYESVIACKNAMLTEPLEVNESNFENALERANKLARLGGGTGHSNFRKGIRVSFDIKYPQYLSMQLQRYKFIDIVSSTSKMHKLMVMDVDGACNKYVTALAKANLKELVNNYNNCNTYEAFMMVISNCPMGLELWMRVSTNYEQLATIYHQRKHHRLREDWGAICKMIRELPYAKELIICE